MPSDEILCSFPSRAAFLVALSSAPGLARSQVVFIAVIYVVGFDLG